MIFIVHVELRLKSGFVSFRSQTTVSSENGKKSRKQRLSDCFTWYDGSQASITLLFSCFTKVSCFLIGRQGVHYGSI